MRLFPLKSKSANLNSMNIIKLCKEISRLRNVLKTDKEALKRLDPSFETWYQFLFHAGYRALRLYRLSRAFYLSGFKFLAYLIYHTNRILYSVDIHPAADIEPGVVIDHGIGVVIGSTAVVGTGTVIYHGVTLGAKYITTGKRHPTVGRNVIIGAGAKILGPIEIGDYAKIGANAVVIESVPKNVTVAGIPAKIVKINNSSLEESDSLCKIKPELTLIGVEY